ncbi:MAG: carbohydrate ABC transporter permease [Capsulimonadales bacterium]|nr:carbohydrate ABC transporter permease [Capsulimonadales bacterium]
MRGAHGFRWVRFALLTLLGLAISLPFVWMVSASFKPRAEVEQVHIVPHQPTTRNYPIVLNLEPDPVTGKTLDLKFGRWYFNSVFMAVGITFLQVLTSAMAAYAFARMRWKGRDTVFLLYIATMMVPGAVLMIPNFQIMVWLGFLNTYHGLILPAAFSAFGTFLLRQFMLSISPTLDEAATIDGATHTQVFWDVVLPLARPGLIALTIITFLGSYQSFFWPLVMLNQSELYPLSVGMLALDSTYGRQTELIMAATVMNIVPLIVIFLCFQRFLVQGLQVGGVKG